MEPFLHPTVLEHSSNAANCASLLSLEVAYEGEAKVNVKSHSRAVMQLATAEVGLAAHDHS